ncbi:WD40 repeat-like protein [Heliocybe sulcata]|uniref:WD40 repeat-like protein n=1 Tax=Heliocybe sulcata TaxID=5364 RepID=A0A5C3NBF3_9AGAM|nr:WD40 repeat-like protein [Heliocybe sulcata]
MENDLTFIAPEGVYSVTEEHKPIALHVPAAPALYPTRISTVTVRFAVAKTGTSQGFAQLLGGNKDNRREKEREKERAAREKKGEDSVSLSSSDTEGNTSPDPSNPSAGQDNPPASPQITHDQPHTIFSHPTPIGKKKTVSRPKHNLRTTSSTFITRLQTAEGLAKSLQSKQGETTFLFYNTSKNFFWTEAGAKLKDPLARITFSAYPTCHDVNLSTASSERLDIVIGFSTGDLVWFDPINSRYGRLNKGGSISNSPCTSVRWVPSSPTLFLVSHADGTIIIYDKERDDGTFTPQLPYSMVAAPSSAVDSNASSSDTDSTKGEWNPLDRIFVTMPPWHPVTANGFSGGGGKGEKEKEKAAKNPVSHWRVSRRSVVGELRRTCRDVRTDSEYADFVFSPDVKYVACISEDGCLRVIDALAEQLVDCYASYFGALTSVAWSPDGKFIITGGQDDLVTIFSPWEQRVIARCQGHSSFVSALAFDDIRCDGRTYRFGSVGEDNKLILWDFSSGALHRPKLQAAHHQRMSMSSSLSLAFRRDRSTLYLPPLGSPDADGIPPLPRYHPAPSRNEVAIVQPVLVKHTEGDLLSDISFLPRGLITANKAGYIKFWIRPLAVRGRHLKTAPRGHSLADVRDLIA